MSPEDATRDTLGRLSFGCVANLLSIIAKRCSSAQILLRRRGSRRDHIWLHIWSCGFTAFMSQYVNDELATEQLSSEAATHLFVIGTSTLTASRFASVPPSIQERLGRILHQQMYGIPICICTYMLRDARSGVDAAPARDRLGRRRSWAGSLEGIARTLAAYGHARRARESGELPRLLQTLRNHLTCLRNKLQPEAEEEFGELIKVFMQNRLENAALQYALNCFHTEASFWNTVADSHRAACVDILEECFLQVRQKGDEVRDSLGQLRA